MYTCIHIESETVRKLVEYRIEFSKLLSYFLKSLLSHLTSSTQGKNVNSINFHQYTYFIYFSSISVTLSGAGAREQEALLLIRETSVVLVSVCPL